MDTAAFGGDTKKAIAAKRQEMHAAADRLDFETAALLWVATDGLGAYPANVLIAGGTASGKTTTMNRKEARTSRSPVVSLLYFWGETAALFRD